MEKYEVKSHELKELKGVIKDAATKNTYFFDEKFLKIIKESLYSKEPIEYKKMTSLLVFTIIESNFGVENFKMLKKIWNTVPEYPVEHRGSSSMFRSPDNVEDYIDTAIYKMKTLLKIWHNNCIPKTYFEKSSFVLEPYIEDVMAYYIDKKEEYFLAKIEEILKNPQNNFFNFYGLIKGIFKSHDRYYQGKILDFYFKRAFTKEQESVIIDNINCGVIEVFIEMLERMRRTKNMGLLEKKELLSKWTEINISYIASEKVDKFLKWASIFLNAQTPEIVLKEECDRDIFFIFLWSAGIKNIKKLKEYIEKYVEHEDDEIVSIAVHFMNQIGSKDEKRKMIRQLLERGNNPVYYFYLVQLFDFPLVYPTIQSSLNYSLKEEKERIKKSDEIDNYEVRELYFDYLLKVQDYVEEGNEIVTFFNEDTENFLSKNVYSSLMALIVYDDMNEEKIDILCTKILELSEEVKLFFLIHFVKGGRTKKQREFLLQMLKESTQLKERAIFYLKNFTLNDREIELVSELFISHGAKHREKVINTLLNGKRRNITKLINVLTDSNIKEKVSAGEILKEKFRVKETKVQTLEEKEKKENIQTYKDETLLSCDIDQIKKEKGYGLVDVEKRPLYFSTKNINVGKWKETTENFFDTIKIKELISKGKIENLSFEEVLELYYYFENENLFKEELKNWKDNSFKEKILSIEHLQKKNKKDLKMYLEKEMAKIESFNEEAVKVIWNFYKILPKTYLKKEEIRKGFQVYFKILKSQLMNDDIFVLYFKIRYMIYKFSGYNIEYIIPIEDYIRACSLNIIEKDEIYQELLLRENNYIQLKNFFEKEDELTEKYKLTKELNRKIIDKIVDIEVAGQDADKMIFLLKKIYGSKNLLKLCACQRPEEAVIKYTSKLKKREVKYNHMFKICVLEKGETYADFADNLKIYKSFISNEKLVEMALVLPRWREYIVRYLDWKELKGLIYYFSAIMNINMEQQSIIELTKLSKRTLADFREGKFDFEWLSSLNEAKEGYGLLYNIILSLFDENNVDILLLKEYNTRFKVYRESKNRSSALNIMMKIDRMKNYLFPIETTTDERKRVKQCLINKMIKDSKYGESFFLMVESENEEDIIQKIKEYTVPYIIPEKKIKVWIKLGERGFVVEEENLEKIEKPLQEEYCKDRRYSTRLKKVAKKYNNFLREGIKYFYECMEAGTPIALKKLSSTAKNPLIKLFMDTVLFSYGEQIGYVQEKGFVNINGIKLFTGRSNEMVKVAHPYQLQNIKNMLKEEFKRKNKVSYLLQLSRKVYDYDPEKYKVKDNFLVEFDERTIEKSEESFLAQMKQENWDIIGERTLMKMFYYHCIGVIFQYKKGSKKLKIKSIAFYDTETGERKHPALVEPVVFSSAIESIIRKIK